MDLCDEMTNSGAVEETFVENLETPDEPGINSEKLANAVHTFPILYDKKEKYFHRKDMRENAWREVANKLGLAEDKGHIIESEWKKLRERYARLKRDLKDKLKSGTSTAAVSGAKRRFADLSFLSWLDEFSKPRKSKSNMKTAGSASSNLDVPIAGEPEIGGDCFEEEDGSASEPESITSSISSVSAKVRPAPSSRKSVVKSNQQRDEEELNILRSLSKVASNVEAEVPPSRDEWSLFGEVVAQKMRKLSEAAPSDIIEDVEHDIMNLLHDARKKIRGGVTRSILQPPTTMPQAYHPRGEALHLPGAYEGSNRSMTSFAHSPPSPAPVTQQGMLSPQHYNTYRMTFP